MIVERDDVARIKIRIAVESDVGAMFDVRTSVKENHLSREELAELGITPETLPDMLTGAGRGWVAEDSGRVVGFAMVNSEISTLFALFVLPDYEGQGIGKSLLRAAENWLAEQGCQQVWLLTEHASLVRATGFYRNQGWQEQELQDDGQMRYVKNLVR